MAITLTASGTLTSPPTVTECKPFADNYTKLSRLSKTDQLVVAIQGLIPEVNALVSKDYESDDAGLIRDASLFTRGIDNFDVETGIAAAGIGISILTYTSSSNLETLLVNGKALRQLPEQTLRRILAYLRYKSGV